MIADKADWDEQRHCWSGTAMQTLIRLWPRLWTT